MNESHPQSEENMNSAIECRNLDRLIATQYDEIASKARRLLRQERPSHTLQTSALVHEAYLRMLKLSETNWQQNNSFMPISTTIMRRVLVDHARNAGAHKRGGEYERIELSDVAAPDNTVDISALDDALVKLADRDAIQASIVEHRYFGGMTIQQTSEALGLSPATVKRKWAVAQAWLYRELQEA